MGNEAGDLGGTHAGIDKDLLGGLDHGGDGVLVGLTAVHPDGDGILCGGRSTGRMGAAAAGDVEDLGQCPVAAHAGSHDSAGSLAVAEDGGAGTVPEENASIAVLPVDDGGKLVCTDDQNRVGRSGRDVGARRLDSEQES